MSVEMVVSAQYRMLALVRFLPSADISLFNFLKEVANMSLIFLSLCFFNEALLIIPLNIAK